jgi:hypothetical protein
MVDYRSLSLKEKLEDGLNVKVDLLGSVLDAATVNTLIRSGFTYKILERKNEN